MQQRSVCAVLVLVQGKENREQSSIKKKSNTSSNHKWLIDGMTSEDTDNILLQVYFT